MAFHGAAAPDEVPGFRKNPDEDIGGELSKRAFEVVPVGLDMPSANPLRERWQGRRACRNLAVQVKDFLSSKTFERRHGKSGPPLTPSVPDGRALLNGAMIDPAHDGRDFNIALADENKTACKPPASTTQPPAKPPWLRKPRTRSPGKCP